MRARISSSVTTISGDHTRSSSSGMNSMKRTTDAFVAGEAAEAGRSDRH